MEYASNKDVNALGGKVEKLRIDVAGCQGRNETVIIGLQKDTELQWEEIGGLRKEIHTLALGLQTMRDTVISTISTRIGLVTGIIGIIIIALQVASIIKK